MGTITVILKSGTLPLAALTDATAIPNDDIVELAVRNSINIQTSVIVLFLSDFLLTMSCSHAPVMIWDAGLMLSFIISCRARISSQCLAFLKFFFDESQGIFFIEIIDILNDILQFQSSPDSIE